MEYLTTVISICIAIAAKWLDLFVLEPTTIQHICGLLSYIRLGIFSIFSLHRYKKGRLKPNTLVSDDLLIWWCI